MQQTNRLSNVIRRDLSLGLSMCFALLISNAVFASAVENVVKPQKINISPSFKSSIGVDELCYKIASKLGSVRLNDCKGRGMEMTEGYSVGGLPIIVKEYGPMKKRTPLGRVLLIGGIHGDEYSSVSMVFKWMKFLDRYHSGMFHWKMVPLVNPDGLLQKKSQRMNKNGVDLNRNFPTPNWEAESKKYWQKTARNPRRYPGVAALSEPESQWLSDYIMDFKPDVIVSIHAPFGVLDFDGPRKAPKHFGLLQLNLLGTYPGSLGNYAGINQNIPVVTIELPYAGIMPKDREIRHIWRDLIKWLKTNASDSDRHVQDINRASKISVN